MLRGYQTVRAAAEAEFTEKKSRFIGYIEPVSGEEEALAVIARRKALHREATHNVYAYSLRGGQVRCSDDGEPQGTAGVPVLEVLQKSGVTDACFVVTRYFGGTLLGAGGLVRAYSQGASLALKTAELRPMNPCTVLALAMDYALYGKVSYLLPSYNAVTLKSDFGAEVALQIMLRSERAATLQRELDELTAACVKTEFIEEKYADID